MNDGKTNRHKNKKIIFKIIVQNRLNLKKDNNETQNMKQSD